jgi:polysaccharide biosynthesis/export protein
MRIPLCLLVVLMGWLVSVERAFSDDYKTGPGDVLNITVYDNADLSAKVRISPGGTIVMPLLGKVDIDKMTIDQITEKITKMLADGYLVSPQVNIFVEDYRSKGWWFWERCVIPA